MSVSMEQIKVLRERTNSGFLDCKQALIETSGDLEKAVDVLRKKGLVIAAKKTGRTTKEGCVGAYIHLNGKIGVLVEINCETDFVARNELFCQFVKDIAMQIAASSPHYLKTEDVPTEAIEREKDIFKSQAAGKPEHVIEKMLQGKLAKFYEEVCLLEQPFIRDDKIKIKDYLTSVIAKTGENIIIKRFTRFQLGEEI